MTLTALPAASRVRLAEAELSSLWEGQKFPREALRGRDGRRFRVIYRGRRTGGPGPDFRDAVIATREELLQGDVELHVRSSDFLRHGHHRDPVYDRVVLHLVFSDDGGGETELACGRQVPVVALGDWVDGRATEIRRWLDRPGAWREPCFTAVERLGVAGAGAALDRLGDMRLRARSAAAAKALQQGGSGATGADSVAWTGIVGALGYGGQRELLEVVAEGAPWQLLLDELAGLRPGERRRRALGVLMRALDGARLKVPLVLRPLRPANRPESRLQAAAALASRFAPAGILVALGQPLSEAAAGRPSRLIDAFGVPALVGRARSVEILTNAVLPALAAAGQEQLAEAAYRAMPLPVRYGAVKHIHAALCGEVPLNARRQQGMLYLLKQYCSQGGCGKCPLS